MFKKFMVSTIVGLMALSVVPFSGVAQAQSKKEMMVIIERLENQVEALRVLGHNEQGTQRRVFADIAVQISALETQMRSLTGRMETIEYNQAQMAKKLELLSAETNLRFEELAAAKPAELVTPVEETTQNTEPATTSETKAVPVGLVMPEGSAADRYTWAYEFVRTDQLDSAKEALAMVYGAHPNDPVAGNAHYWLGKVHLLQKNPGLAAQQFFIVFEQYTKHPKRPDALFELGGSLAELGENEQACEAYYEFKRAYPDASKRTHARADAAMKRLGCIE